MKKIRMCLIGTAALAATLTMFVGPEAMASYFQGASRLTADYIEEQVPMEIELSRLRQMIEDRAVQLGRYGDKIEQQKDAVERVRGTAERMQKEIAGEQALLAKATELLGQQKSHYFIAGHRYSYAEVNEDAVARFERSQALRQELEVVEGDLGRLERDLSASREKLAAAESENRRVGRHAALLASRENNSNLRMELAEVAGSLSGVGSIGSQSALESVVHKIESRIRAKDRRAERKLAAAQGRNRVDYGKTVVTRDFLEIVDATPQPQPRGEAPTERPSAIAGLESGR